MANAKLGLSKTGHFLRNALTLATLSKAAYADDVAKSPEFQATVFGNCRRFENKKTNTQGFVAADDKHVVLAFRGTSAPQDFIVDASVRFVEQPLTAVHAGFGAAIESVWTTVGVELRRLWSPEKTLWVTGHSLGGALAVLAATLMPADLPVFQIATFGQPRVGDKEFAATFKSRRVKLYRFVNNNDVVPTVPGRSWLVSIKPLRVYQHVGDLQFFNAARTLIDESDEELGLTHQLLDALSPLAGASTEAKAAKLLLGGLRDHAIDNYIACLKHNLKA
jgi:hypothetical protein